jgi:protein-S-isoprenylcysteine O-methyltransferase Ste14
MGPGYAIIVLWLGFIVSWLLAALWSSPVQKRAGMQKEFAYRAVLLIGGLIFAIPARNYSGPLRLWRVNGSEAWICVTVIALGFAFCWWARAELGALWSGQVVKKAEHRIVDSGPYGVVRHPIYTGILLAVFATAAAKGTVLGLIGAFIITAGIWMKAVLEESWLRDELNAGAYDAYRRRVPMLVPFGPMSG